ncbi:hypothetical protein [Streptomyces albidoflavus]|uniref:hypothetical protein n=1 Tax=Streptomyces albidoflavus TaxID=1886 RepID=UPI0033A00CBC
MWSIPDVDGTGRLPDGLGHQEFREKVYSLAEGCVMSWSGVREFAAEIGQCFDLLVVDDLGDRLVTLAAVDSGSWGS